MWWGAIRSRRADATRRLPSASTARAPAYRTREGIDVLVLEHVRECRADFPLVDHDARGEPGAHLLGIGDRAPHDIDRSRELPFEAQDRALAGAGEGCFFDDHRFLR